jgi:hypothetical protein
MKRRRKKCRKAILAFLDKKKWPWNRGIFQVLSQIDSKLFGMRCKLRHEHGDLTGSFEIS